MAIRDPQRLLPGSISGNSAFWRDPGAIGKVLRNSYFTTAAPSPPAPSVPTVTITTDGADYVASRTTAVATGAADATRQIVAIVLDRDGNQLSSATFGGVPATIRHSSDASGSGYAIAIVTAAVPSGSGNQNCTLNFASWGSGGFFVVYFVITGVQATPVSFAATRDTNTNLATAALTGIQAGDLILAMSENFTSVPTSFSGSTESFPNADNSQQKANIYAIRAWKQAAANASTFNVRPNVGALTAAIAFRPVPSAGGNTYEASVNMATTASMSPASTRDLVAAILLPAMAGIASAPALDRNAAISLATAAGFSTSRQSVMQSAIALGTIGAVAEAANIVTDRMALFSTQMATAMMGGSSFEGAISLGTQAGLSTSRTVLLTCAATIAASAAMTATSQITAQAAMSLFARAGLSNVPQGILNALASFVAQQTVSASTDGNRTFEAALTLAIVGGIQEQARLDAQATGAIMTRAGLQAIANHSANASAYIAAVANATATAANLVNASVQISTLASVTGARSKIVSGEITLPTTAAVLGTAQAAFQAPIVFSAEFSVDASAALSADAAVSLALQQAILLALSGQEYSDVIELAGLAVPTVSLTGNADGSITIQATVDKTINLEGRKQTSTALTGTMELTVALKGRLN